MPGPEESKDPLPSTTRHSAAAVESIDRELGSPSTAESLHMDHPLHAPASGPTRDPEEMAADGDAPDNQGRPIGPHDPPSMHRAEDDARVLETSPEFNDLPGSGKHRGRGSDA